MSDNKSLCDTCLYRYSCEQSDAGISIANHLVCYGYAPIKDENGRKMSEENHEYKCDICKHRHECVRVSAFIMANVYPYSDECKCFEKRIGNDT